MFTVFIVSYPETAQRKRNPKGPNIQGKLERSKTDTKQNINISGQNQKEKGENEAMHTHIYTTQGCDRSQGTTHRCKESRNKIRESTTKYS